MMVDAPGGPGAPEPGDGDTSWAERLLMVVSAAFTLVLFAFVIWQAVTTPATATPAVAVTGTQPSADGVLVTVVLRNPQDLGIVRAAVTVDCGPSPPTLTFEHVPADGRRTGYVVCPSGTGRPDARLTSWTEA